MKKKQLLYSIFFCLILLFTSLSFPQQRQAAPVKLDKLSDNLYQILGGRGANGGLYIGDNGVLVIDTNTSLTHTAMEIMLQEINFSQKQ